jgi:hypothetical protein
MLHATGGEYHPGAGELADDSRSDPVVTLSRARMKQNLFWVFL